GTNDFVVPLDRTQALTGIVIDVTGARIADARVTATSLSTKQPQTRITYSDTEGLFAFSGLASGPYHLATAARLYCKTETPLALTGEDVQVVMQKQPIVKLRVVGHD